MLACCFALAAGAAVLLLATSTSRQRQNPVLFRTNVDGSGSEHHFAKLIEQPTEILYSLQ